MVVFKQTMKHVEQSLWRLWTWLCSIYVVISIYPSNRTIQVRHSSLNATYLVHSKFLRIPGFDIRTMDRSRWKCRCRRAGMGRDARKHLSRCCAIPFGVEADFEWKMIILKGALTSREKQRVRKLESKVSGQTFLLRGTHACDFLLGNVCVITWRVSALHVARLPHLLSPRQHTWLVRVHEVAHGSAEAGFEDDAWQCQQGEFGRVPVGHAAHEDIRVGGELSELELFAPRRFAL